MEYSLTWSEKATPAGRLICRLRASARRTSDKDCSGWPSPNATRHGEIDAEAVMRRLEKKAETGQGQINLCDTAKLTGWPTVIRNDAEKRGAVSAANYLAGAVQLTGWTTACASDSKRGGTITPNMTGSSLGQQSTLAGWVSPSARDHKDSEGMATEGINPDGSTRARMDQLPRQVFGVTSTSSTVVTKSRGVLEPALARWLMGYPAVWDVLAPGSKNWALWQQRQTELAESVDTETR
jgi:hypothetical protein